MRYALIAMAFALSGATQAANLKLNGEYGCEDQGTQQSRHVLMQNIVSDNPHYVAQRAEMRESLVNLSTYMCKPLTGEFKVMKRQGVYTQVKTGAGPMWVTE
ncbi:hypothetical protein [Pseudomonas fluorescens]|uniref:DUF2790 domain-containing protein n=1 Tax=Pseudomonas fluorescens TaxID=294 RepID=A0A5E7VCA9_PSEFL|nr:hypothetical protein [Pseudomonas fluorescens]VVQ19900.1 hypothetical protein PS941_04890 [Pseudomonas fluorescens]